MLRAGCIPGREKSIADAIPRLRSLECLSFGARFQDLSIALSEHYPRFTNLISGIRNFCFLSLLKIGIVGKTPTTTIVAATVFGLWIPQLI